MNPCQEPVLWHWLKEESIVWHRKLSAATPALKLPEVGSGDASLSKNDH